jgi:lysyl-tRNA synthetase class 2
VNLFRFIPGYETAIYDPGREPALVMLVSFLITFALTRASTRIARVRGWGSTHVGVVHMHHLVVGLVLALGAGALQFALLPDEGFFQLLLAAAFGSGAALVLDEFALVFHLQEVYWEREGRKSVDAVVIAIALGAVFLLHTAPLGTGGADDSRLALTIAIGLNLGMVLVAALKGKLFPATFGVFIPLVAIVGAIRLAEPGSIWSHRRYGPDSKKQRRTEERYAKYEARWRPRKERVWDVIGGETGRPESAQHGVTKQESPGDPPSEQR